MSPSPLCPLFPSRQVAPWLAVGPSCAAPDAAKYPSTFVDRRGPSCVHTGATPGTGPAGVAPKASRRRANERPSFLLWPCRVVCVHTILEAKWDDVESYVQYTTGTRPYLTCLLLWGVTENPGGRDDPSQLGTGALWWNCKLRSFVGGRRVAQGTTHMEKSGKLIYVTQSSSVSRLSPDYVCWPSLQHQYSICGPWSRDIQPFFASHLLLSSRVFSKITNAGANRVHTTRQADRV